MIVKIILLITLTLTFCKESNSINMDDDLRTLFKRKNNIIAIVIDQKAYNVMKKNRKSRDFLIKIGNRIKEYSPTVLYFDFFFIKMEKDPEIFANKLNENFPTISLFDFNKEEKEINFTDEVKQAIGSVIKGTHLHYEQKFSSLSGVEFPPFEIIRNSKAICFPGIGTYEGWVTGIIPYYKYKDFLFESCPVTIVNEFLFSYNMKIGFDIKAECVALYSIPKNINIKCITGERFTRIYEMPIKFKSFQNIKAEDFLEKEFNLESGMIFIVSTNVKKYKDENGQLISDFDIIASEVYTLLDLISQPLEKGK